MVVSQRPKEGLCVDGSCLSNPGEAEYQGMNLLTGKKLFQHKIGHSTNNVAEYVAIVHAIKHCMNSDTDIRVIYTDSQTAMAWIRKKHSNSNVKSSPFATKILIRSAEILRGLGLKSEGFDQDIHITCPETGREVTIKRWMTKLWGENPADFGRKGQYQK